MDRSLELTLANRPWVSGLQINVGFSQAKTAVDFSIVRRVREAYMRAIETHEQPAEDMWTGIGANYHGELQSLLLSGDLPALDAYLRALPMQHASFGYFQGKQPYEAFRSSHQAAEDKCRWYADAIAGLAEMVGATDVRNPEQGEWDKPPFACDLDLQRAVEAATGLSLAIPDVFDGYLSLGDRTHARAAHAMAAVLAVRRLEPTSLAEIGPGIGLTALYTKKLGIRHTLYDLPIVNVAQGYFLLHALGDVKLYGEEEGAPTRVLPAHCFGEEQHDVTLNMDSFPEISRDVVADYVGKVDGWLYSINQESQSPQSAHASQLVVRDVVGRDPVFRAPNWTRRGYVDELYLLP